MDNLLEILLGNKEIVFLVIAVFLYLIFRKNIYKIKFNIPLKPRVRIINQNIKGLENLTPEKAAKAREELGRITELQNSVIRKIIFKIRKQNLEISQEELSSVVMSEYEREKVNYPKLKNTYLKDFKIEKAESPLKNKIE